MWGRSLGVGFRLCGPMGCCLALLCPKQPALEPDFNVVMSIEATSREGGREGDPLLSKFKPPSWEVDDEAPSCYSCQTDFSGLNRRHHCRSVRVLGRKRRAPSGPAA